MNSEHDATGTCLKVATEGNHPHPNSPTEKGREYFFFSLFTFHVSRLSVLRVLRGHSFVSIAGWLAAIVFVRILFRFLWPEDVEYFFRYLALDRALQLTGNKPAKIGLNARVVK